MSKQKKGSEVLEISNAVVKLRKVGKWESESTAPAAIDTEQGCLLIKSGGFGGDKTLTLALWCF
jgi:hypothetical protein